MFNFLSKPKLAEQKAKAMIGERSIADEDAIKLRMLVRDRFESLFSMATDKVADDIRKRHKDPLYKVGDKVYANMYYRCGWRGANREMLDHSSYEYDKVLVIDEVYYCDLYLYNTERFKDGVQERYYDNNQSASDESLRTTFYNLLYAKFATTPSIMECTGWVYKIPTNHGHWHSGEQGLILCDSDLGRSYQRYIDLKNQVKTIKDEMTQLETLLNN